MLSIKPGLLYSNITNKADALGDNMTNNLMLLLEPGVDQDETVELISEQIVLFTQLITEYAYDEAVSFGEFIDYTISKEFVSPAMEELARKRMEEAEISASELLDLGLNSFVYPEGIAATEALMVSRSEMEILDGAAEIKEQTTLQVFGKLKDMLMEIICSQIDKTRSDVCGEMSNIKDINAIFMVASIKAAIDF